MAGSAVSRAQSEGPGAAGAGSALQSDEPPAVGEWWWISECWRASRCPMAGSQRASRRQRCRDPLICTCAAEPGARPARADARRDAGTDAAGRGPQRSPSLTPTVTACLHGPRHGSGPRVSGVHAVSAGDPTPDRARGHSHSRPHSHSPLLSPCPSSRSTPPAPGPSRRRAPRPRPCWAAARSIAASLRLTRPYRPSHRKESRERSDVTKEGDVQRASDRWGGFRG